MSAKRISLEQAKKLIIHVCRGIQANKKWLSHADQAIGDGDHGIGMARGFEQVEENINEKPFSNCGDLFNFVGTTLLSSIGGASGAVFGSLFLGVGKAFSESTDINSQNFSEALESGLNLVQKRGCAKVGDKTMVDALSAAVETSFNEKEKTLDEFLLLLWKAAEEGLERTKHMSSNVGKSKTLGERSIGHPDPGAISMTLILKYIHEFVSNI